MPTVPDIAMAGAGRMARTLGRALREAGLPVVRLAGRSPERAAEAAAFVGGGCVAVTIDEAARRASCIIIAVSDAAIEPVARDLASAAGRIRIALHTCGAAGPEALQPLAENGTSCGVMHPLQTVCGAGLGASTFRGVAFGLAGDPEALGFAEEAVARLGGQTLRIPPGAQQLYHAAAVMASNYLTAMLDAAAQALAGAGMDPARAMEALAPLARTAVENAAAVGPVQALTGPIARGDVATVAAHIRALGQAQEALLEVYRGAGLRALDIARRRGLAAETCASLEKLLRGGE